jgi:hypothetical protein
MKVCNLKFTWDELSKVTPNKSTRSLGHNFHLNFHGSFNFIYIGDRRYILFVYNNFTYLS